MVNLKITYIGKLSNKFTVYYRNKKRKVSSKIVQLRTGQSYLFKDSDCLEPRFIKYYKSLKKIGFVLSQSGDEIIVVNNNKDTNEKAVDNYISDKLSTVVEDDGFTVDSYDEKESNNSESYSDESVDNNSDENNSDYGILSQKRDEGDNYLNEILLNKSREELLEIANDVELSYKKNISTDKLISKLIGEKREELEAII